MKKKSKRFIGYGGALISAAEKKAIMSVVNKNWWPLAEEGKKMEQEAAKQLGVKYGVLANSGSSAGLLALSALELPEGSEVIISATTFPTIFNIILQLSLVPVVVDTKVGTYNLTPEAVEKAITKKTKAIIAIHAVGNPCDMPALRKIANKHDLYLLEDNCDGWGSTIGDKKVGAFGDVSFTSFHAAHIVAMGQGGGIFTNDKRIAKNARMYRDWGRQADLSSRTNKKWKKLPSDYDSRFIYEKIGYNLSPLELQAAMGRVQLKQTNKIKRLRAKNFKHFYKALEKYSDYLVLPEWLPNAEVCWFAFPLSVRGGIKRADLVAHLEARGIETRSMFAGNITLHPAYQKSKYRVSGKLTGANTILKDSFWFSVHPRLTADDRAYVLKAFDDFFAHQKRAKK